MKLVPQCVQNLPSPMMPPSAPTTSLGAGTAPKNGRLRRRPSSQTARTPTIEMMPRSVVGLNTALRSLREFKTDMRSLRPGGSLRDIMPAPVRPPRTLWPPPRAPPAKISPLELEVAPGCAHPEASRTLEIDVQDLLDATGPCRHDQHAVGEEERLLQVVGDEEHGLAHAVVGLQQELLRDAFREGIHRAERLVEEQHLGIVDERAGDLRAPAHARGQLVGI